MNTGSNVSPLSPSLIQHFTVQYRAGPHYAIIKMNLFRRGLCFFLGLSSYWTGFALHPSINDGFSKLALLSCSGFDYQTAPEVETKYFLDRQRQRWGIKAVVPSIYYTQKKLQLQSFSLLIDLHFVCFIYFFLIILLAISLPYDLM